MEMRPVGVDARLGGRDRSSLGGGRAVAAASWAAFLPDAGGPIVSLRWAIGCDDTTKCPSCRHDPSNGRKRDKASHEQQHPNDDYDPQRCFEKGQCNTSEGGENPGRERGDHLFGHAQQAHHDIGGVAGRSGAGAPGATLRPTTGIAIAVAVPAPGAAVVAPPAGPATAIRPVAPSWVASSAHRNQLTAGVRHCACSAGDAPIVEEEER